MNAVADAVSNDMMLNQMLTFALDGESYGVDIQRVQEIRGWSPVRHIPEAPHHVLGVLDLRGTIVPIVDLRAMIGLSGMEATTTTVIIVLSVETASGSRLYGIVVDRVSDVADVNDKSLRPVPAMGSAGSSDYLRGLVQMGDSMVLLLDIDKLLGGGGMSF